MATRDHSNRIARIAWFCAFVLPLILAIVLLVVKSADAIPPLPGPAAQAIEGEAEEEAEEEGEEEQLQAEEEAQEGEEAQAECELTREEFEEGEASKGEVEEACSGGQRGGGSNAGNGCPLRSAHVHAIQKHGRLKVTIGYTSAAPTAATIEVRAGSRRIASLRRKLGMSGVIRIAKKVRGKAVRRISVRIKAPSCSKPKTASAKVRQA